MANSEKITRELPICYKVHEIEKYNTQDSERVIVEEDNQVISVQDDCEEILYTYA